MSEMAWTSERFRQFEREAMAPGLFATLFLGGISGWSAIIVFLFRAAVV